MTLATLFALLTNIVQKISSSKPSSNTTTANTTTTFTTNDTLVSFLDSPFLSSSINTHFTTHNSTVKATHDSNTTTNDLEVLLQTYSTVSRLAYLLILREDPTSNMKDPAELVQSVSQKHFPYKTTQKKEKEKNVEGNHYGNTLLLTTTTQPHSSPSSSHSVGSDPTRLGRSRRGKRRAFLNHDRNTTTITSTTTTDSSLSCTIPSLPENYEVTHSVDTSSELLETITTCTNYNKMDKMGEEGHWNYNNTVEHYRNNPCNGILRRRYRRKHHHQRQRSNDSFSFVVDDADDGKNIEDLNNMENTTKKLFNDNIVPIILDLWNQQQCSDQNNENYFSLVDYFPTYLTTTKEKKQLQLQQHHHQEEEDEENTTRKKKSTPFLEIICGYLTLKSMEQMCIHNNTNMLHLGNEGENHEDPIDSQSHNIDDLCHYLIRQSGCLTAHTTLAIRTCIELTRHILASLPDGKLYNNSGHCQQCSTKDTPTFVILTPSSTLAFTEQSTICPFCLSLLQKRLESILCIIDCSVLTPQNRSVVTSTNVSTNISTVEETTTTSTSTSLVQSLLGLVKVSHLYMLKHGCSSGADMHHNINLDDTDDTTKKHDKPWVQNIIRSCLSVLTSLGHENCQVGKDILASMTVTSTDPPKLPMLYPTGYDLILDLLYYNACEFSMRSCHYTVSKDDVSIKKEKIPSYDTCIFCLNILTNTIETMGEIAKTRILNYSLQEDRHARMTGLSQHNLHNQCAVEEKMDSTSSENNDSFLRWLANWIGNLIRVAFQSSTSADSYHIKDNTSMEGRRRTCNDADEREKKKEDDILSHKEVECLVLAGNGCILLTWLLKQPAMDQSHSQKHDNNHSYNVCGTSCNRDVCCIVIPELTQVVPQRIQDQNEKSENAIDVVVKTLKAFLNYYVFSVGESSIVVVDPILKLLYDLEAMKESKWIQELCKI